MRLASIDRLNLPQAWTRAKASVAKSGIPDRLPIEVLLRLINSGHAAAVAMPSATYAPGSPVVVFAPKESKTLRPFVALPPIDHVLYQALVDECIPHIIKRLPADDVVFQYRPLPTGRVTFDDKPTWGDFVERTRSLLSDGFLYVLETDIAGFFLHIRPEKIIPPLLEAGAPLDVCRDLQILLAHFELHGVQGLPQGQAASSALSNVALQPLDGMLREMNVTYARWSDDLRIFAETYGEARLVQEQIERRLFEEGFTLAPGKTFVLKAATALRRLEDLDESLAEIRDRRIREVLSEIGPYDPEDAAWEDLLEEASAGAIESLYEDLIGPIRASKWSSDPLFHRKLSYSLRALAGIRSPSAIEDATSLAWRYPDEIEAITTYLRRLAELRRHDVAKALTALHAGASYAQEYRRLAVASAAAALAVHGPDQTLSDRLAMDASSLNANPILRRRAGLAAVALGPRSDPETAMSLWESFDRMVDPALSKLYLVMGAQKLGRPTRDSLYSRWKGESRLLTAAMESIEGGASYDLARL
jgi:hypothetical protein